MCCGKNPVSSPNHVAVVVGSFGCWRDDDDDDDDGDDGERFVRGGRLIDRRRRRRYETEEKKGRADAAVGVGECGRGVRGRTAVADVQRRRADETEKVGAEAHDDRRQHVQGGEGRPEQAARAVQREPERVLRVGLRDRHPRRRLRLRRGGL